MCKSNCMYTMLIVLQISDKIAIVMVLHAIVRSNLNHYSSLSGSRTVTNINTQVICDSLAFFSRSRPNKLRTILGILPRHTHKAIQRNMKLNFIICEQFLGH